MARVATGDEHGTDPCLKEIPRVYFVREGLSRRQARHRPRTCQASRHHCHPRSRIVLKLTSSECHGSSPVGIGIPMSQGLAGSGEASNRPGESGSVGGRGDDLHPSVPVCPETVCHQKPKGKWYTELTNQGLNEAGSDSRVPIIIGRFNLVAGTTAECCPAIVRRCETRVRFAYTSILKDHYENRAFCR